MAPSLLAEDRYRRFGDVNCSHEVKRHLLLEHFWREIFDRAHDSTSGVVNHDVEAAEMIGPFLHRRLSLLVVGDIKGERKDTLSILLDQVFQLLWPAGGRDKFVASFENRFGKAAP